MPPTYLAFGLNINSSHPIPGLPLSPLNDYVDVQIVFEETLSDLPPEEDEEPVCDLRHDDGDSNSTLRVWKRSGDRRYRFRYGDGTEFVIEGSGSSICAAWPESLTLEDASTYLMGPVLGFVLRLRGSVCLHASAVVVDGSAVAFLAPPGYGKSTLAAGFAMLGHPVLTDDITALVDLVDTFLVRPAFPRLHLWPQAVQSLFGSVEALPRICPDHPTWDKRYLLLDGDRYRFQQVETPLAAVYAGVYSEDQTGYEVEPASGHSAVSSLVANSYSWYALDGEMRAREFDLFSRIATNVPLRIVRASGMDPLDLNNLCGVILDDFHTL